MEALHQPGDVIRDRYRIKTCLGRDSVGVTYAAEDLTTDRQVAIKVLSLGQMTDSEALELLDQEARVLENLDHPAIPHYLEHFQIDTPEDCRFYLVQELEEGDSLAGLVQKGWQGSKQKPKGSRVKLEHNSDRLIVKSLSDGKVSPGTMGAGGIGLLMLFLLVPFTWQRLTILVAELSLSSLLGGVIFFLIIVPLFCLSLWLFSGLLYGLVGSTRLEINRRFFLINRCCLGFCRQRWGQTADIDWVGVRETDKRFILRERKGKEYFFDKRLSVVEQEWLAAEIEDFLRQLSL